MTAEKEELDDERSHLGPDVITYPLMGREVKRAPGTSKLRLL